MYLNMHFASKLTEAGFKCFVATVFLFQLSCTNLFTTFATTDDDESQYFEALEGIRKGDFTGAITACELMSAVYITRPEVANVCASAYAGRCGFATLGMVADLDTYSTTVPPEKLFHWFLTQISGTTATNISDCNLAVATINNVGPAANRSEDLNVFMTLLSMYSISVVLNVTGDAPVEDNVLDGGFDACAISDANAQVTGFSFWELYKSLTELSADPNYSPLYTVVDGICTLLSGESLDLCAASAATAPTALTAAELNGARSVLKEGASVGVDQCGGSSPIGAACKCP